MMKHAFVLLTTENDTGLRCQSSFKHWGLVRERRNTRDETIRRIDAGGSFDLGRKVGVEIRRKKLVPFRWTIVERIVSKSQWFGSSRIYSLSRWISIARGV